MKTIRQIAKECNLKHFEICNVVRTLEMEIIKEGKFILIDKHQEDLIHNYLTIGGKLTELTLESKMNLL